MSFVVVRELSGHTSKKTTWKVLSRHFEHEIDAKRWLNYMISDEGKKAKGKHFMVVEIKLETLDRVSIRG